MMQQRILIRALIFALFGVLLFSCSDSKDSEVGTISLTKDQIVLANSDTETSFSFTTNQNWTATVEAIDGGEANWCTVKPSSGRGGENEITITTTVNTTTADRAANIVFRVNATTKTLLITQQPSTNTLIVGKEWYILDGNAEVIEISLRTNISYTVEVPTEFADWIAHKQSPTRATLEDYTELFEIAQNTTGASRQGHVFIKSNGEERKIVIYQNPYTATNVVYESTDYSRDGELIILQKATKGKGIDIVLMGDGFVDRDMATDGVYEMLMRQSMESFFSVEPTKSYRDYFNVYMVKVVSRNELYSSSTSTALKVEFGGGTYVYGDDDICASYASKAPLISLETLVIVVVNRDFYAGTTGLYSSGSNFAYVARSSKTSINASFSSTLIHEAVGHGFGLLGDEYYNYSSTIPEADKLDLDKMYNQYGWYSNLDYRNTNETVKWSHFIGHPNYSYVGLYEGGLLYRKGVWRPEYNSCMNNNIPYFNAPSREAIVKRIKRLAGETYTFNDFVARDLYQPYTRQTRATDEVYIPLPSPVFKSGTPNLTIK